LSTVAIQFGSIKGQRCRRNCERDNHQSRNHPHQHPHHGVLRRRISRLSTNAQRNHDDGESRKDSQGSFSKTLPPHCYPNEGHGRHENEEQDYDPRNRGDDTHFAQSRGYSEPDRGAARFSIDTLWIKTIEKELRAGDGKRDRQQSSQEDRGRSRTILAEPSAHEKKAISYPPSYPRL